MPSRRITDRIFQFELPIPFPLETTNVYLIDVPPRTLIDTGIKTDASFRALKSGMEALGFDFASIERILITHGHIDHYGHAKRLAALSGAPVFIHPVEYGKIRSTFHSRGILKMVLKRNGAPEPWVIDAVGYIESAQRMADPLEEAFFLEDGDTVPFDSLSLQAVHCPGHSPGLLCFYWKEGRILFTGDHLLKEITPNPIINIPREGPPYEYPSLKQYLASLERIRQMEIGLALPGHGELIDNPKGVINGVFKHHRERINLILSALSTQDKTPYEIAMEIFPLVSPFDLFLGISEVLGHLEILKGEEKVRVLEKEGIDYYSMEL